MPSENYEIGSGMTEQELQLASWWARHGMDARSLGRGALVFVGGLLWMFVLWTLLDTYAISYPREHQITARIANNQLAAGAYTPPQPVQTSDVLAFQTTGNRNDFLVEITNPNQEWWADFTYHFNAGGELTPTRAGYALPNSQRYLTELGWKGKNQASSGQLVVDNLVWHRVHPEDVERDYNAFSAQRFQLSFSSTTYTNDLKIDNHTVGQTSTILHNPAGYGFWGADVTVILYRANVPVAVTTITEKEIKPGENRPLIISWFDNLPGINKTDIRASVNLLDPSVYLPSNLF